MILDSGPQRLDWHPNCYLTSMANLNFRLRFVPVSVVSVISRGLVASIPVWGLGCGDDSTSAVPIDTVPGPDEPGAGLDTDRPDPCRGVALPADQHYVASGLCASAVALDQEGLRQISFASNGDLIGVRVSGEVVRFRDANDDGMFGGSAEIVTIANTGGSNGNNAHLDEASGFLYAGSPEGVVRWPYSAETAALGAPQPVVVNQPSTGTHTYHTVHVYDGWLYVHSGSEDNMVAPAAPEYDTNRSLLKRFDLAQLQAASPFDWGTGEIVALGLRNMVGYTRDDAGNLFGVVNGIDDLKYRGEDVHLDNPGETLIRIEPGQAFGYPYCFTAQNVTTPAGTAAPGTQLASEVDGFTNPHDDAWCEQNSEPPLSFLPAHSAPLDITFYNARSGTQPASLPTDWVGGAFVSQHGSWNTMPSVGHNVVLFPFGEAEPSMPRTDQDPPAYPFTVVFGGGNTAGHADGEWGWSSGGLGEDPVRPVGVAVSPLDGALYVSSDGEGALYRIGVPLSE
jgi:glucose/arabinose dehydrogenase